jgi:undecaprenyl-diphosphatase
MRPTHQLTPARLRVALNFARREIGAAAALLLAGFAGWSFLSIAGEVREGDTTAFDHHIIMALRAPGDPSMPIGPHWLRVAALDVTSLGSVTVLSLLVVAAGGLFLALRRRREAVWLVCASLGGWLITDRLKAVFGRERPPLSMHVVEAMNASFPSGHSMLSATIYLTLGVLIARFAERRRVKVYAMAWAVAFTLMVGISRVYLGVHWPTDVLAGWCLGALWAMAIWLLAWALERRWRGQGGTVAPPIDAPSPPAEGNEARP